MSDFLRTIIATRSWPSTVVTSVLCANTDLFFVGGKEFVLSEMNASCSLDVMIEGKGEKR